MQEVMAFLQTHWILSGLLILILVALVIVEKLSQRTGGVRVNPNQALELINHNEGVVADLRDKAAYKNGHIVNSLSIGSHDIDAVKSRLKEHQWKPIILISDQEGEASKLAGALIKEGFKETTVLAGGLRAWRDAKLPLEKK